jgi:hypothetical protein
MAALIRELDKKTREGIFRYKKFGCVLIVAGVFSASDRLALL